MNNNNSSITIRPAELGDVDDLYKLIVESTAGETKITATSLRDDLFNLDRNYKPEVGNEDPSISFDTTLINSDKPVVRSILAEKDNNLIGYVMFQYYYSPWSGHSASLVDLFIVKEHRRKGIARRLLNELSNFGKSENLQSIIFNSGYMNQDLINKALKNGFAWYRNDDTDWSVLRIDFK